MSEQEEDEEDEDQTHAVKLFKASGGGLDLRDQLLRGCDGSHENCRCGLGGGDDTLSTGRRGADGSSRNPLG